MLPAAGFPFFGPFFFCSFFPVVLNEIDPLFFLFAQPVCLICFYDGEHSLVGRLTLRLRGFCMKILKFVYSFQPF